MLLIMDHCEHVTDVLSELHSILADCPGVFAIVTSQQAVGVTSEQELWLHPLALPPGTPPITVDAMAACAAVQVFVARARRRDSSFSLSDGNDWSALPPPLLADRAIYQNPSAPCWA